MFDGISDFADSIPAFAAMYDQEYMQTLAPLPKSFSEALDALERDQEWAEAVLGKDVVKWYLLNKRHEVEYYGAMDADARKKEMVKTF